MAVSDELEYLKSLVSQLNQKITALEAKAKKTVTGAAPTPAQQLRTILIGPPGAGTCRSACGMRVGNADAVLCGVSLRFICRVDRTRVLQERARRLPGSRRNFAYAISLRATCSASKSRRKPLSVSRRRRSWMLEALSAMILSSA